MPLPKDPDWLDKAARHAAHDIVPGCREYHGPNLHTAGCDRITDTIIRHMRAALALQREKTE